MTSEHLFRQTERGKRAQIALDELEAAFDALEADCWHTFKDSGIHDAHGHAACLMYLRVLDDVKDRFALALHNGEAARRELSKLGGNNPT